MIDSVLRRIPVVGGLGYAERVGRLPAAFTATLAVEPENRYFPHAVAVLAGGEKVGYVAPEISRAYAPIVAAADAPVTCPARAADRADRETSGVLLFLDFSALPQPDAPSGT